MNLWPDIVRELKWAILSSDWIIRFFISSAAMLVNVMAIMEENLEDESSFSRTRVRYSSTRLCVFPLPAEAFRTFKYLVEVEEGIG